MTLLNHYYRLDRQPLIWIIRPELTDVGHNDCRVMDGIHTDSFENIQGVTHQEGKILLLKRIFLLL